MDVDYCAKSQRYYLIKWSSSSRCRFSLTECALVVGPVLIDSCEFRRPSYEMLRAALSIGASCTIGDVVCQHLSDFTYDARRTAAFALSGLCVLGPLSYTIMSSATARFPGSSTDAILKRVIAMQLIEPMRIGPFLPMPLLLQGAPPEQAVDKLRSDLLPTVVRSWSVFTAPLVFCFVYLRPENRVPLMATVGACWNTYMSYVTHRTGETPR